MPAATPMERAPSKTTKAAPNSDKRLIPVPMPTATSHIPPTKMIAATIKPTKSPLNTDSVVRISNQAADSFLIHRQASPSVLKVSVTRRGSLSGIVAVT
jgi:hypothetical protein